jgi:hypothetical protein
MRLVQSSTNPSLTASCNASTKSSGLQGSCSTLDSTEQEQEQQHIARAEKSRSLRDPAGQIADAIKACSLEDKHEALNKNESKSVRARLVIKKKSEVRTQPLTPSKGSRRMVVRRKSFFGMTGGADATTVPDDETKQLSKKRAETPSRSGRNRESRNNKAPVTPVKKSTSRVSLQGKSCNQTSSRKISLLHSSGRSLQLEISLPGVSQPRRVVSRVAPDFMQSSQRDLSVQDIIDEYNKIAGEGLEVK